MINYARSAEAGARNADQYERKVFDKPHLDPLDVVEKLRKQGMHVDSLTALPYLDQAGSYRMKGYWYQWQDPQTKTFRKGTHFDQIIERYEFDRELRRTTADALERLELMVRAAISNVMSKHEGPHWFMNPTLFVSKESARADAAQKSRVALVDRINEEVERMRRKPFIEHYRRKYHQPTLPPSWAISECLSFGCWSTAYPTLASLKYRKEISRRFRVEDHEVFASWLHTLSVMRNTVAHHGRLLGAMTGVTPKEYRDWNLRFNGPQARTFFVTATVINFLCQSIKRGPDWKVELETLFAKYPHIPVQHGLGFPADWDEAPGWHADAAKPAPRARQNSRQGAAQSPLGMA